MTTLYGAVGYVLLNNITDKQILVFSDVHDKLLFCPEYTHISEWIKTKMISWKFLLEEIDRNGTHFYELWGDSIHTQKLKQLYLDNPKLVTAIDVRPKLLLISWELYLNNVHVQVFKVMTLSSYLLLVDTFFKLDHPYFIQILNIYNIYSLKNTLIGKHFYILKSKYKEFKQNNRQFMHYKMSTIIDKFRHIVIKFNSFLDDIMEWYTCALIYKSPSNIILHTGLAHSEKIINLLMNIYKYNKKKEYGINKLIFINQITTGCVTLD